MHGAALSVKQAHMSFEMQPLLAGLQHAKQLNLHVNLTKSLGMRILLYYSGSSLEGHP